MSQFGFVFDENSVTEITWLSVTLSFLKTSVFRRQNVFLPHENEQPAFTNSCGLQSAFEKLCFRDGVGLELRFLLRQRVDSASVCFLHWTTLGRFHSQVQVHLKQCHPVVCLKQAAVFKRKLYIKQGLFCWTDGMFIRYGLLIKIGTESKGLIESRLRTLTPSECVKLA